MTQPQPGPELDAKVAREVMGWERTLVTPDDQPWWIVSSPSRPVRPCKDWQPSTRIQDAWEVVEHLRARLIGHFSIHTTNTTNTTNTRWRADLADGTALAPTPALAICLAALTLTDTKD